MATRQQIDRIAHRIEALATSHVSPEPPPECWIVVDGDKAYQRRPFHAGGLDADAGRLDAEELVITVAELEARPTGRSRFPTRILRVVVDSPRSQDAQE